MSVPLGCTLHPRACRLYSRESPHRDDLMRTPILFATLAAGISMLLPHVPPAQPHRIGPAEIYPDPVRTPGAVNPQVTQQNIKDNICNRQWSTKQIRPPAHFRKSLADGSCALTAEP